MNCLFTQWHVYVLTGSLATAMNASIVHEFCIDRRIYETIAFSKYTRNACKCSHLVLFFENKVLNLVNTVYLLYLARKLCRNMGKRRGSSRDSAADEVEEKDSECRIITELAKILHEQNKIITDQERALADQEKILKIHL